MSVPLARRQLLFRKGRVVKKFPEEQLLEVLLTEVAAFEKRLKPRA